MEDLHRAVRAARQEGEARRLLEAALFMAPGPLSARELARIAGVSEEEAVRHARRLRREYLARETGLEIVANGETDTFQMRVRPEFADAVRHLALASELSEGEQRTLALIAVREPVLQSEVIAFRNTRAYDHIRVLVEKGFVERRPVGRSFELRTTRKFYDYFGEVRLPSSARPAPPSSGGGKRRS